MSLQWLSVAAFLYTEIGIGLLLCLGIISNQRWQGIFTSRLLALLKQHGNFLFSAFVLLLFVLFTDSIFSTYRFSQVDTKTTDLHLNPQAQIQAQMKLFRAQRNLYITGFSVFMLIVLRRLVTLISHQAKLEASHEAAIKQAKGASEQAKKLLDENELLRKNKRNQSGSGSDVDADDEKVDMKNEIIKLNEQIAESKKKHEKAEADLSAMKAQSEGLTKEYDRLLLENEKLEKKLSIAGGVSDAHGESKKEM